MKSVKEFGDKLVNDFCDGYDGQPIGAYSALKYLEYNMNSYFWELVELESTISLNDYLEDLFNRYDQKYMFYRGHLDLKTFMENHNDLAK
jgi:hypothetical protein